MSILLVLSACNNSKVGSTVVKAISVYMVNLKSMKWIADYQVVKKKSTSFVIGIREHLICISSSLIFSFQEIPFVFSKRRQMSVAIVDNSWFAI
jgi:hypothetical protein